VSYLAAAPRLDRWRARRLSILTQAARAATLPKPRRTERWASA